MVTPDLQINDLVQILIPNGSAYSGKYRSRVEDIDNDVVILAVPIKNGSLIPLHPGEDLMFCKLTDTGISVYKGKINERRGQARPLVVLSKPLLCDKLQRRKYFRFPMCVQTRFAKIVDSIPPDEWVWEDSVLRNLSGGGLCLTGKLPLNVEQRIIVDVPIDKDTLRLWGKIKRVSLEGDKKSDMKDYIYVAGVEFIDLLRGEQERIIQYVFTRQRGSLIKGK